MGLGETALSEIMCREWFQRFKSGDFDVEDRHGGAKENIFEDSKFEAYLLKTNTKRKRNWLLGNTEIRGLTPPTVLSRRCSFRLPFVSIDGTWPGSLISISTLMKKSNNLSIRGSPQKTHHLLEIVSDNFQKDEKK